MVAQQYMQDRGMWKRTSLFWAQHFANAPGKKDADFERAFLKVIEMGVDSKNRGRYFDHIFSLSFRFIRTSKRNL